MLIFAKDPVYEKDNDCCLVGMLLHRFLPQPVPGQANAIVALELHSSFYLVWLLK